MNDELKGATGSLSARVKVQELLRVRTGRQVFARGTPHVAPPTEKDLMICGIY